MLAQTSTNEIAEERRSILEDYGYLVKRYQYEWKHLNAKKHISSDFISLP